MTDIPDHFHHHHIKTRLRESKLQRRQTSRNDASDGDDDSDVMVEERGAKIENGMSENERQAISESKRDRTRTGKYNSVFKYYAHKLPSHRCCSACIMTSKCLCVVSEILNMMERCLISNNPVSNVIMYKYSILLNTLLYLG